MVLMTMTMGKRVYAGFRYGEGTGERGDMVEEDLDEGRWTTISGTQQHQHPATSKESVFESLYQQRRQAASLTRCFSFRASISATVSFFFISTGGRAMVLDSCQRTVVHGYGSSLFSVLSVCALGGALCKTFSCIHHSSRAFCSGVSIEICARSRASTACRCTLDTTIDKHFQ